jgi:16S rRNA (guanine527-N7)-methyltransferase
MSRTISDTIGDAIRKALEAAGREPLDETAIGQLSAYVSLILRWNSRINLTAIRDEEGIIARHIVESIDVSCKLPVGVGTVLDFGSGAGLPGIPIAICRPEIEVTLAESQNKKAAFLREAVRVLDLGTKVHSGRAEELKVRFDCVTLRAVDKMATAVSSATGLVAPDGWLALMTTAADADQLKAAAGAGFTWREAAGLAGSVSRVLLLGMKSGS